MKLTTKEKAARYDSLQMAIQFTIDRYRALEREYNSKGPCVNNMMESFNYGKASTYKEVIEDLKMWI